MQEKLSTLTGEVVILTALSLECQAVLAHLQEVREIIHQQGTIYHCGQFQGEKRAWNVAVVEIGMGGPAAAAETERALNYFHPEIALFVGVAGGLKEVRLGDVVASMKVTAYEVGKAAEDFESRSESWRASYALVQRAKAEARNGKWLARLGETLPEPAPKAYVGTLAAGDKVVSSQRSPTYNLLQTTCKDALAVEMEGHGFLQAVHVNHTVHALVVRGISDLIQGKEQADQAGWQEKAAHHAAAFAFQALFTFDISARQLELACLPTSSVQEPSFPPTWPMYWNIPFARNPFFLGRDAFLERLYTQLQSGQVAALTQRQAISGLGGIGKTQLAVEFAYRHQQGYQAIFWARAEDAEALTSSYIALARLLDLPEKDAQEQAIIIETVKRWLQLHQHWLLILDNADEPDLVIPFLPSVLGGHVLLTTRATALRRLGIVNPLEINTLPPDQGALFLLRRAGLHLPDASLEQASPTEQELARQLSQELDGLPLALDQAGAYLEATGTSLDRYQQIYQQHRSDLLKERRGQPYDHPEPVATTWEVSFQRVEARNPAAADLLRLCAFLAPDSIGEEIFMQGAEKLGSTLAQVATDHYMLDQAIEVLRAYSLITRNSSFHSLTVHRLVQAVIRDSLSTEEFQQWLHRAILAILAVFPIGEFEFWEACECHMPHALLGSSWIENQHVETLEAAELLFRTGYYLHESGRYAGVEHLYQRVLTIRERHLGADHPFIANTLNNLGRLYDRQGQYTKAEQLLERALAISKQQLGVEHPRTASILSNLGGLFDRLGKFAEAEVFLKQALSIREGQLGVEHLTTAYSMDHLGALYTTLGKYAEAEPLLKQAFTIRERYLGSQHPVTAFSLKHLGWLYHKQGMYTYAESLLKRVLEIREKQLGAEHPATATSLDELGRIFMRQGKYQDAEMLLKRALTIYKQQIGENHPATAYCLSDLGNLYEKQGKNAKAEVLLLQSLSIREQTLGSEHVNTAFSLKSLARLYSQQGLYAKAEPLLKRALAIRKRNLGVENPNTATSMNDLGMLFAKERKYNEAETLVKQALAIRESTLRSEHPEVARSLENLASLYFNQGKYSEAKVLYERALAIFEQALGSEHPDTKFTQTNLSSILLLIEGNV